jgi:hypothetical protein
VPVAVSRPVVDEERPDLFVCDGPRFGHLADEFLRWIGMANVMTEPQFELVLTLSRKSALLGFNDAHIFV